MGYCIKCGKQNPDTAKFCTGCGATLNDVFINPTPQTATKNSSHLTVDSIGRENKTLWKVAGTLIILGLLAATYFIFFNNKKGEINSTTVTKDENTSDEIQNNNDSAVNAAATLTKTEIFSFLNEWLNSQNNKNMATYSNFYSQNFQGVKRVKSGQTYYYNHDEWISDRTKMYTNAKNLVMTVSNVKITENKGKTARLNFTHGYSSNAYNDIGVKQIDIEKTTDGRINITREEMLNSSEQSSNNEAEISYLNSEGKLVYKSECYVIVTGSFLYETDTKNEIRRMKSDGYSNAGYLWIPDYPSLSGKQFYAPFIGPFQSYAECENNLRSLSKTGRFWYGIKVSFDNTRVEIR